MREQRCGSGDGGAQMNDSEQRRVARGRPRHGEREGLSTERVVEEALRLVDQEGIDALTMRSLARRVDVEAMSLYAHIPNKDALLNAVADRVASELRLRLEPGRSWQERVRDAVDAWTTARHAHPGAFPLLFRPRDGTDVERALNEEIMDALACAGFDEAGVALAFRTLVSFLDGALLHWPWTSGTRCGCDEVVASVDSVRYPRLLASAPYAGEMSWDEIFAAGVDLFLEGLQQRVDRLAGSRMVEGSE